MKSLAPRLKALDDRINALLPQQYHNCYESVAPESMGSAGLRYGPDGLVAWDEIWTSFCQLALAGGPPHRGTLLEPAPAAEVHAAPAAYQSVVEEIGRGIWLTTQLKVLPRAAPGWVGVVCHDAAMAGWLVRAIVVENVSCRHDDRILYLPAGPAYRLAKEIKNVVTTLAKTCHYWSGHLGDEQRQASAAATLLTAASADEARAAANLHLAVTTALEKGIQRLTAMPIVSSTYLGWVGVRCADVATAVWLLRAVMVENIQVRREEEVLYLPVHPRFDASQVRRILRALLRACQLHAA